MNIISIARILKFGVKKWKFSGRKREIEACIVQYTLTRYTLTYILLYIILFPFHCVLIILHIYRIVYAYR